jgi:hypothetical protein
MLSVGNELDRDLHSENHEAENIDGMKERIVFFKNGRVDIDTENDGVNENRYENESLNGFRLHPFGEADSPWSDIGLAA